MFGAALCPTDIKIEDSVPALREPRVRRKETCKNEQGQYSVIVYG